MRSIICRALLLAAGACVACSGQNPSTTSDAPGERRATEGNSPYGFLRDFGLTEDEMPAIWAGLPYESITLAGGGCFGSCPIYEVTLTRAVGIGPGSASYQGDAFVEREGSFEGTIDLWSYGQLCELFDHLGFRDLEEDYSVDWTDAETLILEARGPAGLHRVIDYGHQGPPELVALRLAVEATVEHIEWEATDE